MDGVRRGAGSLECGVNREAAFSVFGLVLLLVAFAAGFVVGGCVS